MLYVLSDLTEYSEILKKISKVCSTFFSDFDRVLSNVLYLVACHSNSKARERQRQTETDRDRLTCNIHEGPDF